MEKIATISKSHLENYGNEMIRDFWLLRDNVEVEKCNIQNRQAIVNFLQACENGVVAIYNPVLRNMDSKIREELFKVASERCRVYVVMHEMVDCMREFSRQCLIRTGVEVAGSFMLHKSNNNEISGLFFIVSLEKENLDSISHVIFKMDAQQYEDFWHYFCYVFWYKASKEYIDNVPRGIDRNDQKEFLAPYQNGFDINFLQIEWNKESYSNFILQTQMDFTHHSQSSSVYIFQNPEGINGKFLEELAENSSVLINADLAFEAKLGEQVSYLAPLNLHGNMIYALRLSEEQKKNVLKLMKNLQNSATHEYKKEATKRDLIGKEILFIKDMERVTIEKLKNVNIKIPPCQKFYDKEEFEKVQPNFSDFYEENQFTCEVFYQWEIVPFYTPDGCKKSGLYEQWEQCKKQLHDFISKSLKELRTAEKGGNNIVSIVQKILGLNSVAANKEKLERLKNRIDNGSMSRESFGKYSVELYPLLCSSKEILSCCEEYQKWESEKEWLEKDMNEKKQKFHEKEKDLKKKQNDKQKLDEEYKGLENSVTDLGRQIIELKEQQKEQNIPDRERRIQEATKRKKQQEGQQKSLKHKIDSVEKELKKMQQDIDALNKEFESSKNKLEEFGEFQPKNSSYSPSKDCQLNIPKEDLPTIGQLKEKSGQRYLEIIYWEEVQEAKREAERLHAKLCVKPEL